MPISSLSMPDLLEIAYSDRRRPHRRPPFTAPGKVERKISRHRKSLRKSEVEKRPSSPSIPESQPASKSAPGVRLRSRKKPSASAILDKQNAAVTDAACEDIRPLTAEVGLLPRCARKRPLLPWRDPGSSALTTLALLPMNRRMLDAYTGGEPIPSGSSSIIISRRSAVGETGRTGGAQPSRDRPRRARRAFHPSLSSRMKSDFPYAIRISSRKSWNRTVPPPWPAVCAGVLSLMDAGVPIKKPVAGISVGLVTEYNADGNAWNASPPPSTDIIGSEDHFGDMDFKLVRHR